MAKFAQCGYGSQGQGLGKTTDGYTYVVNDNVRTGDKIQVIATSKKGNKFATTAVPLHTYKETSAKGQIAKQQSLQKGKEPIDVFSGKELGVQGSTATKLLDNIIPGILLPCATLSSLNSYKTLLLCVLINFQFSFPVRFNFPQV